MRIGDRIRKRRRELDLTQGDLARELKTDPMTVSRWERGVAVARPETLVKIAKRLRVPVQWLMTGDGPASLQPTGTGG